MDMVQIKLDMACEQLRNAMRNEEAVKRYEYRLTIIQHEAWSKEFLVKAHADRRYTKIYGDALKRV